MDETPLEQRLRGRRVLVIDTETTGLGNIDRLVEVAIVQIDALLEQGRTEPRPLFQSLIDPGFPIPWEATRVHGIRDVDVAGAPSWPEVFEQVGAQLCDLDAVLCAHNAPFDRRFLDSEATPVRPAALWLDTMRICKRVGRSTAPTKLELACRERGIPLDGHRAMTDAMATARLLLRLIPEAYQLPEEERPPERPTLPQWLEWQRRAPRPPIAQAEQGPAPQPGLFGGTS